MQKTRHGYNFTAQWEVCGGGGVRVSDLKASEHTICNLVCTWLDTQTRKCWNGSGSRGCHQRPAHTAEWLQRLWSGSTAVKGSVPGNTLRFSAFIYPSALLLFWSLHVFTHVPSLHGDPLWRKKAFYRVTKNTKYTEINFLVKLFQEHFAP